MNLLQEASAALKSAIDAALAGEETALPAQVPEVLAFVESTLADVFDVPPAIVAVLQGENPAIAKPIDAAGEAVLQLLKARIDALL